MLTLGPNEHEEKKLCKDPDLFELLRNDVSDRLCLLQDDEPDGHDADEAGDRDPLFRDVFEPGEHDGGSKNDQGSSRGAPVILLKETEKQVPRDDADDDSEPLMEGLRLPSWMGKAGNIMGMSGALTDGVSLTPEARRLTANALDGVFPKGKFLALPNFTGKMTTLRRSAWVISAMRSTLLKSFVRARAIRTP